MADINLSVEAVASKVGDLRTRFKDKYGDRISKGDYDARDVKRLESDDAYARCFLRTLKANGDPKKAAEVVHDAFKFRKNLGIWDLDEDSFPDEITQRKGIYMQGQDINGHPILYVKTKENNVNNSEEKEWLRKYIAYKFECHHRHNPEVMCVVIMDMSGASTGNVNIDISKYIMACFTTYFPSFLAYMINYDMPGLLSATWKLISAFMNSDQKAKVQMVKKKDIGKYIALEHQWPHMKE